MDNLFLALLLVSLLGLGIGLAKPQLVKMPSRKIAGWSFGSVAVVFFILFGATTPPTPQSATAATTITDSASTTASTVSTVDGSTKDVYTTVAGQTVYPLKSRYTGDFFVTLDGVPLAFGVDPIAYPKEDYQAVYDNSVPSITLTADPGAGHTLKVFQHTTPTAADGTPLTPEQAQDEDDASYVSYFNAVILYDFMPVGTGLAALGTDIQTMNDTDAISQLQNLQTALQTAQSDLQTGDQTYEPLSPDVEHINTLMSSAITAGLKGATISLSDWESGNLNGATDAMTQYILGTMLDNFADAKAAAAGWEANHSGDSTSQ